MIEHIIGRRRPHGVCSSSVLCCLSLLSLLAFATGGCEGKDQDTSTPDPDDTSDTKDTEDTSTDCPGEARWFCDADWNRAFSVPRDQGLRWEVDPDFFIDDGSVPNFVTLHEGGGYLLLYSHVSTWGSRWLATSADGLEWTIADSAAIPQSWFPPECAQWATDSSEMYLDDGSYRLIVEGFDQANGLYSHCSAHSTDGSTWYAESETYPIPAEDNGSSSVWSTLRSVNDGAWYSWYVGDLMGANDVRVARSEDGKTSSPYSRAGVMPTNLIDPDVVRIEEGGYRSFMLDGNSLELSYIDGEDETTFGEPLPIEGLNDRVCSREVCPSDCYYDPTYLRLADGSMWLYFGQFRMNESCMLDRAGLMRARAVDGP